MHTYKNLQKKNFTFVGARITTDQIIDLRYTLMYLGVPIRSKTYMFGDNKSVVDSAIIPTSTLSKKSTLASLLQAISNSTGRMENLIM